MARCDLPAAVGYDVATPAWFDEQLRIGLERPFGVAAVITPQFAAFLLDRNPSNRPLRPVKLRHYAHAMGAGTFLLNGEPLIISKEGLVNDGQNRLEACRLAGVQFATMMVFGIERDTRTTVDTGAAQDAGAHAAKLGLPNAYTQATIAKLVIAFEESDGNSIETRLISPDMALGRLLSDAGIGDAAHFAASRAKQMQPYTSPGVIGFTHYALTHVHRAKAAAFLNQLTLGEHLSLHDPAYVARNKLLAIGKSSRTANFEVIAHAWNAFREGRPLKLIKVLGGALPEIG